MSKDIKFTFPKEKTKELIDRSYGTAKSHGFHDKELSPQHMLMLAISEVGEAVEADRRGNRADVCAFETRTNVHPDYNERFKAYIKDTVEDELADVTIRIFDFCGAKGVTPRIKESRFARIATTYVLALRCATTNFRLQGNKR